MRCKHPTLLAAVWLAVAQNPNPAAASPYDTEVLVQPHTVSTTFSWQEALSALPPGSYPAAMPPTIVAGPVHGALVANSAEGLQYTPASSFWELGTDSFVVRVPSLDPDAFVTVTLLASDYRAVLSIDESFEGTVQDLYGNATVSPEAAMAGAMGLRAVVEGSVAPEAVFMYSTDPTTPPGAEGNTEELKVRPPPDPPSPWHGQGVGPIVIYALDSDSGQAADLVLTPEGGNWEISARLYDGGSTFTTPSLELGGTENQLRLDWWNAWETQTGGLRLWVDGELAGSITGHSAWAPGVADRRVGAMLEPTAVGGASIDVDDLRWSWAQAARAAFDPILRDGFEDGLGAWNTSAAPYIETKQNAALIGLEGLRIPAVYGFDGALLDSSPDSATSVGVRMRLSVDGLGYPLGGTLELLALSGVDSGSLGDQLRLVLQNTFAGFRLSAQARSGAGWLSTPFAMLTAGTNTVELRWQAADPGDENGWMRLWVNGDPGPRIGELDNVSAVIESLRLGAWKVAAGAQGSLFVDAFESWCFVSGAVDPTE